ncbi:MAG: BTAD domain-containing putative transcriptional regulator [Streptosporangiaceae bacterium]
MTGRGGLATRLRGIAALLTLAGLIIGLPLLLYRLGGSPIPARIDSWSRISRALLHRDNGWLFLAAVRDVSWLAWAAFMVAVLAEAQAALRGRTPPRLRMPGVQTAAGQLVALALLSFGAPATMLAAAAQPAAAAATAPARPAAEPAAGRLAAPGKLAASQLAADQLGAQAAGQAAASQRSGPPAAQGSKMGFYQLVTVRPGDCLWTIAQHYLGNGDRYGEIAALNLGHQMGGGRTFTDPSVIWPGWVLRLPAAAGHDPARPASANGHGPGQHGPHRSRDPRYQRPHPAAGATAPQGSTAAQGSTALQSPGPVSSGAAPSAAAPAPAVSGTVAPASTVVTAPPGAGPGHQPQTVIAPVADTERMPPLAIFAAGMLAGGAVVTLARMRHRQRQSRRRGRRIPLPASAPVQQAEQRLQAQPDVQPAPTLRAALSSLGASLMTAGQPLPEIIAIRVFPGGMDVLLASPASDPPPEPFTVPGGYQGMTWRLSLPPGEPPPRLSPGPGDLLPGLFTAGAVQDGYLLLDLEHLRVTTVEGPADLTGRLLATAVAELALTEMTGWYDLILVGFEEFAEVSQRTTECGNLDEALDLLAARAVALRRRLDGEAQADIRQHRLAAPEDEDWALTLLVSRIAPTPGQFSLLLDLCAEPAGLAALVPGGAPVPSGHSTPASIEVTAAPQEPGGMTATVWPLGLEVWPQPLSEADYAALGSLFATASLDADVAADEPPYGSDWPPWPGSETDGGQAGSAQAPGVQDPGVQASGVQADGAGPGAAAAPADEHLGDDYPGDEYAAGEYTDDEYADDEYTDDEYTGGGYAGVADADGYAEAGEAGPEADGPGGRVLAAADAARYQGSPVLVAGGDLAAGTDLHAPAAGTAPPGVAPSEAVPSEAVPPGTVPPGTVSPEAVAPQPGEAAGQAQPSGPGGQPAGHPDQPAPPALRIGVLGSFTINSEPAALLPAQSQLVLALALNGRDGLSNQQLCYLLGADPDHPRPSDSLRQLIVRTRRQLGRAPDGREWIEHLGSGQYALHPAARFDWAEFDVLASQGIAGREARALRSALGLIRGQPFTGCYYWWLDPALTETVRAQLVDAADLLAELELAADDPAAAARAARTGLAGDSTAEQLWRALMRAEHAAGNSSGVHDAWTRCLDAIADIAPDGQPHPRTDALYRELAGRPDAGRGRRPDMP